MLALSVRTIGMTPTFSFTVRSAVRSSSNTIFSTPGMQVHKDSMSRMNFHSSGGGRSR